MNWRCIGDMMGAKIRCFCEMCKEKQRKMIFILYCSHLPVTLQRKVLFASPMWSYTLNLLLMKSKKLLTI